MLLILNKGCTMNEWAMNVLIRNAQFRTGFGASGSLSSRSCNFNCFVNLHLDQSVLLWQLIYWMSEMGHLLVKAVNDRQVWLMLKVGPCLGNLKCSMYVYWLKYLEDTSHTCVNNKNSGRVFSLSPTPLQTMS